MNEARYKGLPSDQHRHMFLDAALLLRDRPAAHLLALWEGQLLLDSGRNGGNRHQQSDVTETWDQSADAAFAEFAPQKRVRAPTAAESAASLLADLRDAFLVKVLDRRCENSPWRAI